MDAEKIKEYLANKGQKKLPGQEERNDSKYNWFGKWPQGLEKTILKIFPPLKGKPFPGKLVYKHYQIPGKMTSATCLATHDIECPICQLLAEYEGRLDLKDWAGASRAWVVCRVVRVTDEHGNDMKHDYKTDEPTIVPFSEFNHDWMLNQFINPEVGDITDPKAGHSITKYRATPGGKFEKTISLKPTPLGDTDEMTTKLLSEQYDLDEIWKSPDDNYLKKLKGCAAAIKDVIENRLMTLASDATDTAKSATDTGTKTAEKLNPNDSAKAAEGAIDTTSKPADGRPPNSPDCFGDKEVWYHNDTAHANAAKCGLCAFDHMCGQKIGVN